MENCPGMEMTMGSAPGGASEKNVLRTFGYHFLLCLM